MYTILPRGIDHPSFTGTGYAGNPAFTVYLA
jgi:hypothetical protein